MPVSSAFGIRVLPAMSFLQGLSWLRERRRGPGIICDTSGGYRDQQLLASVRSSSRRRAGSMSRSISTILPCATVKPATPSSRPCRATTRPAAPLTSARRAKGARRPKATPRLATARAPLDRLPPSAWLRHLEHLLMATGALPARDPALARLERWIEHYL